MKNHVYILIVLISAFTLSEGVLADITILTPDRSKSMPAMKFVITSGPELVDGSWIATGKLHYESVKVGSPAGIKRTNSKLVEIFTFSLPDSVVRASPIRSRVTSEADFDTDTGKVKDKAANLFKRRVFTYLGFAN